MSPNVTYTGRIGATKIVIFETDGCPNTICNGTLKGSGGTGYHYYGSMGGCDDIGLSDSINVTPKTDACTVVQQIVASTTATSPGYSTTRNPAYVHAIAFGDLFESTSSFSLDAGSILRFRGRCRFTETHRRVRADRGLTIRLVIQPSIQALNPGR